MTAFLISYDLNDPGQSYEEILKEIKSYKTWAKISESSYVVIAPNCAANAVFAPFKKIIDENDRLYVIELGSDFAGYGPEKLNAWLEKYLK